MRENEELTSSARGTRTMKQCSFDRRSGGATWPPSCGDAFRSGWRKKVDDERGSGHSMHTGKHSLVTPWLGKGECEKIVARLPEW